MLALRIVPSSELVEGRRSRRRLLDSVSGGGLAGDGRVESGGPRGAAPRRRELRFEAVPADAFLTGRIEPGFEVTMERMTADGVDVVAPRALAAGRVLSLQFPASPFLPAPGTLAHVGACEALDDGRYRLRLRFEDALVA